MDLLHDITSLPGHGGPSHATFYRGKTARASQSGYFQVPSEILKSLRNPTSLVGGVAAAKADKSGAQTNVPGPDQEWPQQVLRMKLRQASTYSDWLAAASELDRIQGNDAWKDDEQCTEYNTALVRARMQELEEARISCNVERMLFLVRTSLTRGLGGMGSLHLYRHSFVGTKALIERYIEVALTTLDSLVRLSSPSRDTGIDVRQVYEQLLRARQAFGRSALLLSGGGTLGMNHIGVAKALFEASLLPRIISGASAGSIVAAVICTRTDDEIPELLRDFCLGDLDVFEREGAEDGLIQKAYRFLTKGALFDISNLTRVMKDLLGDMTFQEAYNRTRRILNICVSTASLYDLPRLLNYVTAPNVMIWSAVATSCSVPLVFSPAQLLCKDPTTGKQVPWDQSPQLWIDGSVDNDLPMTRLAEMFNVNHFIVSQVNPHVVPFLERDEKGVAQEAQSAFAAGPSWLRSAAELAKGEALHRMHVLAELGICPTVMSKLRSVLSQKYSGDITILPEVPYTQFPRVLSNPTEAFMVQAMISGERATWPKLSQIRNHCAIELALDDAVQRMRTRLVFSPSQVDLRLNAFAKSTPSNLAGVGKRRVRRRASHDTPMDESMLAPSTRPYSLALHDRAAAILSGTENSSSVDTSPSSPAVDLDDSDVLSSSSLDSPPPASASATGHAPALWPDQAQAFPGMSKSQPVSPCAASKKLIPNPLHNAAGFGMTPRPSAVTRPSEQEVAYKRIFHKAKALSADLHAASGQMTSVSKRGPEDQQELDIDLSGTRGMVRRKRSLSTGLKGIWPPKRR